MNLSQSNIMLNPPLETKLHVLPFDQLTWEDFEKLCLRLVETEFTIHKCERYGVQGENQQGIDIFARLGNGLYSVYQCKKYDVFTKTDLDNVIEKFEKGEYFNKSKSFHICTACELNSIHIQDAFEKHENKLKSNNIDLIKWDKIQLSRILKPYPQIVYDYFGKEYVRLFNGEDALSSIVHLSEKQINSYLESASSELYCINNNFHIPDTHIKRKETQELFEWIKQDLNNTETNVAILTGGAGTGKTVILKDLLNLLYENKIPVLGLKADKKYINLEDIGKSVLDENINIKNVFRQLLVKNEVVVLIVDQIDALSQSLSTNRTQIKAYTSLINQLSRIYGVKVVVSCRNFDLHYDADLKQYINKKNINVHPLSESEVEIVLKKLSGKKISYFPKKLIELLKTPLHLEVFCRIYNESTITNEIRNLQDLYRNLWNQKVKEAKNKIDIEPSKLEFVLYYIAENIYNRQDNLCIPSQLVDTYYNEVKYLKTEGLIIENKENIQFFHQSFYDYCYARNFVETQGGHLFVFLTNLDHQGLFIRSLIRQVISYLRIYNPKQYSKELQNILFSENVRYHIKQLIIDQLSFEENPKSEELRIIIQLTKDNPILASSFFNNIPNENWHKLFIREQQTLIKLINEIESPIHESIVRFIVFSVNNNIEATYKMFSQITDEKEKLSLIDWTLIRTNDFTLPIVVEAYNLISIEYVKSTFQRFHILDKALFSNPDFAIKEALKVFNDQKQKWKYTNHYGERDESYHDFDNFCENLYKTHPEKAYPFLKFIMKEFIADSIVEYKYNVSILDEDYAFQNYQPKNCEQHKIIDWVIDYLKKGIVLRPEFTKKEIASYLSGNKATEIFIALQVMAENIPFFIDEIYSVLIKKELIDDFLEIEDIHYWYRMLLEKTSMLFSNERKNILNNFILSYFTQKDFIGSKSFCDDRKKYGTHGRDMFCPLPFWGYNQRILLNSLPLEYIENHPLLKRRLQELNRRFPEKVWECKNIEPIHAAPMAHICGGLLSDEKYKKLSIDQWLKSFLVYDKDIHYTNREYFDVESHARAFKDVVKQDVNKYAEFVSTIISSNEVNIRYQLNGLEGLIEGGYNISSVRNLYSLLMKNNVPERYLHTFIRLSKKFINEKIVDCELINFLKKYVFLPLPPKRESIFVNKNDKNRNDILFSEGFRSLNAAAFNALIELSMFVEYQNEIYNFIIEISSELPLQLRLVVLYEINKGSGFSDEQQLNLFIAYTFEVSSEIYHVSQKLINHLFYYNFEKLIPFVEQTMDIPEAAEPLGIYLLYAWFYKYEQGKELLLKLHCIQPLSIEHTIKQAFKYLNNSELKEKCLFIMDLYVHDKRKHIRAAFIKNFYFLSKSDFLLVRNIIEEFINEQDEDDKLYNLYRYLTDCCNEYYLECIDILKLIKFDKSGKNRKEIEEPIKLLTLSYNAIKEYDSVNPYLEYAMDVFDNLLQQLSYRSDIEEILKELNN